MITADQKLLPGLRPAIAEAAERKLNALGVKIVYNTRVTDSSLNKDGQTVVVLGNGNKLEADLFVPAYGVRPNSSWLPKELLNDRGFLVTNESTLRVDAAGPRVYGFGDVASYSRNIVWDIMGGMPALGVNLKRDLLSFNPANAYEKPKGKDREFKLETKESMIVPIGSGGGVGAIMGWKLPSFVVWLLKGRDFMLGMSGLATLNGDRVKEVKWTAEEAAI